MSESLSIRKRMVMAAKDKPCADCCQVFHFSAMDFDHLPRFPKMFELSHWVHYNRRQIAAEIAKCDVVCANCHRLRTWKRSHGLLDDALKLAVAECDIIMSNAADRWGGLVS